jgi:hypothetical protein
MEKDVPRVWWLDFVSHLWGWLKFARLAMRIP